LCNGDILPREIGNGPFALGRGAHFKLVVEIAYGLLRILPIVMRRATILKILKDTSPSFRVTTPRSGCEKMLSTAEGVREISTTVQTTKSHNLTKRELLSGHSAVNSLDWFFLNVT